MSSIPSRTPYNTPIMQHTSAIVRGLIAEAASLRDFDQNKVKGQLRELFVSKLLTRFLTTQFGIGVDSVIVNQLGVRSKEIDLIVYDKRILPPFVKEQDIGLYPAESVLAGIEVRSWVDKSIIQEYANEAKKLYSEVYDPNCSHYRDYDRMRPFYSLVGFYSDDIWRGQSEDQVYLWMMNYARPLFGVCVLNKFSWLNVMRPEGSFAYANDRNEETKTFMAVLLDNIRTYAEKRYISLLRHNDWFSIYTRDQNWREGEF